MRWVTRQDVGLDRVAGAWLSPQWIDPQAEIRYLAAEAIPAELVIGLLPVPPGNGAGVTTMLG